MNCDAQPLALVKIPLKLENVANVCIDGLISFLEVLALSNIAAAEFPEL